MKSSVRVPLPLAAVLVAVLLSLAFVAGSVGSAVGKPAAAVTKAQVKKLVKKGIAKEAPKLSVANAGAVDGIDSASLVQTPGRMQVLASGHVDSNGTLLNSVGQFTVTRLGVGEYVVIPASTSLNNSQYMLIGSPGIAFTVRSLIQLGTARFYTYKEGDVPADGSFAFVIYKIG